MIDPPTLCNLGWANLLSDATQTGLGIIRKTQVPPWCSSSLCLCLSICLSLPWAYRIALGMFLSCAFLPLGKRAGMKSERALLEVLSLKGVSEICSDTIVRQREIMHVKCLNAAPAQGICSMTGALTIIIVAQTGSTKRAS